MSFDDDRKQLARVLRRWKDQGTADEALKPKKIQNVLDRFIDTSDVEISRLLTKTEVLEGGRVWIKGPSNRDAKPHLYPVLTVELAEKGGRLSVGLRLAVLCQDSSDRVIVDGWRLESAEPGDDAPHRYPHLQRIVSWTTAGGSLLWPDGDYGQGDESERFAEERTRETNETRPAFPLGCLSPAGLALAMVASLAGGDGARKIYEADSALSAKADAELRKDFAYLRLM